jgi:hypothetical protein
MVEICLLTYWGNRFFYELKAQAPAIEKALQAETM